MLNYFIYRVKWVCSDCAVHKEADKSRKCGEHNPDDIIGYVNGNQICRYSVSALMTRCKYVNDEILNAALSVLQEKHSDFKILDSKIFNNKPDPLMAIVENNLFKKYPNISNNIYNKILMPINLHQQHWVLMVIDFQLYEIRYRDSLDYKIPPLFDTMVSILSKLFPSKTWQIREIHGGQIPESNDCAAFVVKFANEEVDGTCSVNDENRKEYDDVWQYREKMFRDIMNHIDINFHVSSFSLSQVASEVDYADVSVPSHTITCVISHHSDSGSQSSLRDSGSQSSLHEQEEDSDFSEVRVPNTVFMYSAHNKVLLLILLYYV